MNKTIIFDLDGTIFDTKKSVLRTFNEVIKGLGFVNDEENIKKMFGLTLDQQIKAIFPKEGSFFHKIVKNKFSELYDTKFCTECNWYSGLEFILLKLSKSNNLSLVTNKRLNPTLKILKHKKIEFVFDEIYTPDISEKKALKHENITRLIENQNIRPTDALYIGDTMEDKLACDKSNVRFIGVGWGYGAKDLRNAEINLINTSSQLMKAISLK
mgnify:CR=1 FL=1